MRARRLSGYAAILALAWNPIAWMVNAVGFVDSVRAAMDPAHWMTRLLFWPSLGVVISSVGLLWVGMLARRSYSDRRTVSELNREANWASQNLRDRQIKNATEEAQLHRDYGRWRQRVDDRIAPFERRFPSEFSSFTTLGERVEVNLLEGITREHSRLQSMVELEVTRLRDLTQAIQGVGWLD